MGNLFSRGKEMDSLNVFTWFFLMSYKNVVALFNILAPMSLKTLKNAYVQVCAK